MTLQKLYSIILSVVLLIQVCQCSEIVEQSQFAEKGLFQFSLSTNNNLHQQNQYLLAQVLDCNYYPEFRYYHSIGQEVILQIEIGKNKINIQSVMQFEDYYYQTLLLNFSYDSLTSLINVEIHLVQDNQRIMQFEHQENLKQLNIIQIGGQDEGFQQYSGMIWLNQLALQSEQLTRFINGRLKDNLNEFQHIVLNNTQRDFQFLIKITLHPTKQK